MLVSSTKHLLCMNQRNVSQQNAVSEMVKHSTAEFLTSQEPWNDSY